MSYDLMVFDPVAAPKGRDDFMRWYDEQTEWPEDHGYQDPSVCSPVLQKWLADMTAEIPNRSQMSSEDFEQFEHTAEYNTGRSIIYVAFSWSSADLAQELTFRLAKRHRIGFFNIATDNSEVWMPAGKEGWEVAHTSADGIWEWENM